MSGGVDMSLPKEQELLHEETCDPKQQQHRGMKLGRKKPAVFLSFRHLNMLALMVIFSASGLVCAEDLAFVVLSIMYTYFLSRVAFPRLEGEEPTVFSQQNKLLQQYVLFAAVVGLFLPIAYILVGFFQDDQEGIKAASPHVFLLASQVFMEGVAWNDRFSTPIRVFVPVFYNSRRIFTLFEWLREEFAKEDKKPAALFVGRALAVINMALWSFNLFGFLLPVYLPKAFKRYYSLSKSKD
ncbi:uncharacterized protein LOC111459394 [Cucurbita moschata]|uniref:Uncharacterized protein LOC111459394 n=1 Tax=Cucurbita moschata TaxID=3662 RepID=A0A6J1H0U3_CUCMO|nr:uncharacterized protein LOC111459394 [Cucurbita moschata]